MKNVIYTGMFLCFTVQLVQAQANFAPLGARWTYSEQYLIIAPWVFIPYTIEVESIELFQGQMCSKIRIPFTPSGLWVEDHLYVFERSDSVFFWSTYSEAFELLYDFTAETGDSWVIGGLPVTEPTEYDDFLTVTVDSMSTIVLNGVTLKVWHFAPSLWFDWGTSIIEGIGCPYFMVPSFGLFESKIGELRCYSDVEDDYQLVSYPCDEIILQTSVQHQDQMLHDISVSPNPFDAEIYLSVGTPGLSSYDITIRNVQGQAVYTARHRDPGSNQALRIDPGLLSPGIYFIQVTSNGMSGLRKIVKK